MLNFPPCSDTTGRTQEFALLWQALEKSLANNTHSVASADASELEAILKEGRSKRGQEAIAEVISLRIVHTLKAEHLPELAANDDSGNQCPQNTQKSGLSAPPAGDEIQSISVVVLKLRTAKSTLKRPVLTLLENLKSFGHDLIVLQRPRPQQDTQVMLRYYAPKKQKNVFVASPWMSLEALEQHLYPQGHSLEEVYTTFLWQIHTLGQSEHEPYAKARIEEHTPTEKHTEEGQQRAWRALRDPVQLSLSYEIEELNKQKAKLIKTIRREPQLHKKSQLRDKCRAIDAHINELQAELERLRSIPED